MKIGIIAWDYEESESLGLELAAKRMGHIPLLFTLDDVTVDWGNQLNVRVRGEQAEALDVIISRVYLRSEVWQADTEKLMLLSNLNGVLMIDPAAPFIVAKSKLLMMQKLAHAGLCIPPTTLCRSLEEVRSVWSTYGHVVLKPSFGYGGNDVQRVDNDFTDKNEMIQYLLNCYKAVLVQPFLAHPQGDMRVTVVGDDIGFSYRRIPQLHAWKTNVALGASVAPYTPTPLVREIALKAAQTMDITIAGLDIIEYEGDHVIMEINTVPGWYPLQPNEQEEAAAKIIRYAISSVANSSKISS